MYEYLQDVAKKQTGREQVSLTATLFAGGSAGIAYWIVGMPADVLKSRLQTGKRKFINFIFVIALIIPLFKLLPARMNMEYVAFLKS